MKKAGTVQVFEDLTLNNFTWNIESVLYGWRSSKASVEVIMQEDGSALKHSRRYDFDCPGSWTDQDAMNAILSLDQFKDSTEL